MRKAVTIISMLLVALSVGACQGNDDSLNAIVDSPVTNYFSDSDSQTVKGQLERGTRVLATKIERGMCAIEWEGGQVWVKCTNLNLDEGVNLRRVNPVPVPSPILSGDGSDRVEYRVGGTTSRASLTYNNETGNTEQREVSVPWSQTYYMQYGEFMYISAQNENDFGSVSCEILVNGQVVESAESKGAYVIASCSGSVR